MVALKGTPTKGTRKSKGQSKFMPMYDILNVSSLQNFEDLNKARLTELFRLLQEKDPDTALFNGKANDSNICELWTNIFMKASEGTVKFDKNHEIFKIIQFQSRSLIPKQLWNEEKYQPRISQNCESIVDRFSTSKKRDMVDVDDDELEETSSHLSITEDTPKQKQEDAPAWFSAFETKISTFMQEYKSHAEQVKSNTNEITMLKSDFSLCNNDIRVIKKDVATIKDDNHLLNQDVQSLNKRVQELENFKSTINDQLQNLSINSNGTNNATSIDEFTRFSWYQQHLSSKRKFAKAVQDMERGGYIKVEIHGNSVNMLVYEIEGEKFFNNGNFYKATGVEIENNAKLIQKSNGKFMAIVQVKASYIRRPILTQKLINRRDDFRGKFGLSMAWPEVYNMESVLNHIQNYIDPITNDVVVLGYDKTKRGFPFVRINDVTRAKRDEYVDKHDNNPTDNDLATRVFISCPLEFCKLQKEFVTVE